MSLLRLHLGSISDPTSLSGEVDLLAQPFDAALAGTDPVLLHAALPALPAATELEVILPAQAVRFTRLKLPRVRGDALRRVLPNLIEDSVVGDPAESHAAPIGEAGADGLREVAIVSRDWMKLAQRIIALRRPRRAAVLSEAALLPQVPWLVVHRGSGYLRHAGGVLPFECKASAADLPLPLALRLAPRLLRSGTNEAAPAALPELLVSGLDSETLQAWSRELGLSLRAATWHWAKAPAAPVANSLLQFEFARSAAGQDASWLGWRWPIGLAATTVVVAIAGLNLHWWQLLAERDSLRARMRSDFQAAFPNVPLNTDPLLLARRELARNHSSHGEDPFFTLSTTLAGAVQAEPGKPAVRALEYRAGVLRAHLVAGDDAARIADRARAAGADAHPETPGPDGTPVVVLRARAG
jgi:general secretion pathway protein L